MIGNYFLAKQITERRAGKHCPFEKQGSAESFPHSGNRGKTEFEEKQVSPEKAKTILEDGEVNGHPLTDKQKRFFGFIAGGGTPTKV